MSAPPPQDGPVVVTGAGGFLGRATVAALRAQGCAVRAVTRRGPDAASSPPGIERIALDLAAPGAQDGLAAVLDGATAVIHAAAALTGDDAAHNRDTVAPTRALIAALTAMRAAPRLVLVSSLAVYNYASLPAGATLDETTPLEPEPEMRDAYCRAKLAQEALALTAAQQAGLAIWSLRPGAIFGPGRLRTARLGLVLGPLLLRPGDAAVPAVSVTDCALALARAALTPPGPGDAPACAPGGALTAINVVAPDPPAASAWTGAIAPAGWPRRVIGAPLRLARAPALALALASVAAPGLARRAPGPLRLESFDARFKPLRFSAARLEDRLGVRPTTPFAEAMAQALTAQEMAP